MSEFIALTTLVYLLCFLIVLYLLSRVIHIQDEVMAILKNSLDTTESLLHRIERNEDLLLQVIQKIEQLETNSLQE